MVNRKVYVLNPCYQLRRDEHRVMLFSKVGVDNRSSKDWLSFIHPIQAAMLSFFTYNRSLHENLLLLSDYFSRDIVYMEKKVTSYINNPVSIYTTWKGQRICFPKNVLVELDGSEEEFLFRNLTPDSFMCGKLDLLSRRLYTGPLLITLMLTNKCVTHCKYCYADTMTRVRQRLSTPRIIELINEAAQLQVQQVNLIGGEIFLHTDWKLILSELVRLHIEPEFISTKIPFTPELIRELKETGYNNLIQVSLDACNAKVLNQLLQVNDEYLKEVLNGLELLDQSGFVYQVSTVLTKNNCDELILNELFDFLSTLEHISEWRIVPVSDSVTLSDQTYATLKLSREDIEPIANYLKSFLIPVSPFPIILNLELIYKKRNTDKGGSRYFAGPTCSALNTHLFVLPDGKVTICEQLYWDVRFIIGDVVIDTINKVWNSSRSAALCNLSRTDVQEESPCKTCAYFESCFGFQNRCWSDIIKAYGKNCWDYPDPRCLFAPQAELLDEK